MTLGNANIVARLAQRAALHPDRLAIVSTAGTLTFAELTDRTERVAATLRSHGVERGDRVLVFVPMSIDLYACLLGILRAGCVAVFVDAWADRGRLRDAVITAAPLAFVGSRKAHLLRLTSREVRRIPHKFTPAGLLAARGPGRPVEEVPAAWPALVTFTTGTTGQPKGALRSHGFLVAQHEALAAHLQPLDGDVDMPTLPVFVLNNLATGVTSVIPDSDPQRPSDIDARRIYAQIISTHVTTSSGSPAFYERLAQWCERNERTLPLRALFTGGAPVLPPLAARLRDVVDGTAHIVYGSTEAEPIAGITAASMVALGSAGDGLCVGHPVAHIALRLVRPNDGSIVLGESGWAEWDAVPGAAGEIVVSGAHVLGSYLNDPDAELLNKIHDGGVVWHRTGDAARRDAEGRLWLLGRVRERVLHGGVTWWPLPAEVRALTVAGVRHAAYVGMPGGGSAETRAILCVEADTGARQELEREVTAAVNPWPVDEVRVLAQIPRDPRHASKTDVGRLRAILQEP